MSKTYIVRWTSTTYYTQEVQADSEDDARNKVFHKSVDIPVVLDYTSGVRTLQSIEEKL